MGDEKENKEIVKPKLTGQGGPGRGQGRPKGSKNGAHTMLKSLVRKYTEPAIEELVRIAGMKKEYARDSEGKLVLDAEGNPKLIAIPGSASDTARIQAINILLERGFGKATQKIAGDEDEAPVQVQEVRRRIIRPDDE